MSNKIIVEKEIQQGKKSSLWHLASENAIVIPIIQRDYAQGRSNDDVRQIREPFLKTLLEVLESNNRKQELDFIYGSLEKPKDISRKDVNYENFVPLDGQQRLTTLFLLHWFLSIWNESSFRLMRMHFKDKFSYMTRISSTEFCGNILEYVHPIDIVDSILKGGKSPISRVLKDEGWFHDQWKNDPTISGMLTMLDTISHLFNNITSSINREVKAKTYFKRLICKDIEDVAITFNLLYLNKGNFHLSDELYIKMNSRGKPLSDFETFKARFESFMTKNTNVNRDFAGNIDGIWADVFWNMRNNIRPKSEEDKPVYYRDNTDGMMMNVIKVALANKYAILANSNDAALDELFESQVAKKANPDMHLTFYRYTELGVFNEENDKNIYEEEELEKRHNNNESVCQSIYDAFSFIYDLKGKDAEKYKVDNEFINVEEQLNNIMFCGVDGRNSKITSITYQTRLLFWALSEYCIKYRNTIQSMEGNGCLSLNRWMRFVRNMVESTEINGVSDMQKALKYLFSVFSAMESGDIIAYLSELKSSPECTPFPQSQIKEEILKAQLISCDKSWEEPIIEADNVSAWPGRSGYILFFSGLSDKNNQEISKWDTEIHKKYQDLFEAYKKKMDMLLSYLKGIDDFKRDCLFERAMLSKGCYLRKEDSRSIIYSMMDQSISSRSYSFRQMIQFNGIDYNDDNSIYKDGVECLKAVLDDRFYLYSDAKEVEGSLCNIINDALKQIQDWRWPLLVNSRIWHEAWQRFIWIDDYGTAWVVRQKGGGTNQYETWSYHLHLLLAEKGLKYGYYPHGYPRHTILNFKVNDQKYQLMIRHTSSGKWRFEMVAIDENYHVIDDLDTRKVICGIMPNNSQVFFKDNIHDAVVWADAMEQFIVNNYELF